MPTEFRLPELGENVDSGDLTRILVAVGDTIRQEQPVLELETDKATIEVPCPLAGVVTAIHVKEGEKIKVGQLILAVDEKQEQRIEVKPRPVAEERRPPKKPEVSVMAQPDVERDEEEVTAVQPSASLVRERAEAAEVPSAPEPSPPAPPQGIAPAAPSVRRFARELGIDIDLVPGSGPGGRIDVEDVKAYARQILVSPEGLRAGVSAGLTPLPDFSKWGEIERKPMSSVRRKTAAHMSEAWTTIPHVTHFDKADVTELEQLRKRFSSKAEAVGGKLALTAITLKVVAGALKLFPQFAASFDIAKEEIVYKKYFHIGVAVDTDRGLLVPVIRDVDKKNILQLSVELAELAERARSRKITLEEMEGGVFTITNLGGIGGTQFAPIVNYPEVAILGVARASWEPKFADGQFQPRLMLPLSVSYDHRLIDGADAARFLRWVAEALEQPFLLPLEG